MKKTFCDRCGTQCVNYHSFLITGLDLKRYLELCSNCAKHFKAEVERFWRPDGEA